MLTSNLARYWYTLATYKSRLGATSYCQHANITSDGMQGVHIIRLFAILHSVAILIITLCSYIVIRQRSAEWPKLQHSRPFDSLQNWNLITPPFDTDRVCESLRAGRQTVLDQHNANLTQKYTLPLYKANTIHCLLILWYITHLAPYTRVPIVKPQEREMEKLKQGTKHKQCICHFLFFKSSQNWPHMLNISPIHGPDTYFWKALKENFTIVTSNFYLLVWCGREWAKYPQGFGGNHVTCNW